MRSSPVPAHVDRRAFQRHRRIRQLGYKDYDDYLLSPAWSDVKRRYRASDMPQMCACGATKGLQMHHKTYERVGQERLEDLAVMCKTCHRDLHIIEARGEIGLDHDALRDDLRAAAYAEHEARRKARSEEAKPAAVREAESALDLASARDAAQRAARDLLRDRRHVRDSILSFEDRALQRAQRIARHLAIHVQSVEEADGVRRLCEAVRLGQVSPRAALGVLSALRAKQAA